MVAMEPRIVICSQFLFYMIDAEVDLDYISDILPHWRNKLDHQEMNHAS